MSINSFIFGLGVADDPLRRGVNGVAGERGIARGEGRKILSLEAMKMQVT